MLVWSSGAGRMKVAEVRSLWGGRFCKNVLPRPLPKNSNMAGGTTNADVEALAFGGTGISDCLKILHELEIVPRSSLTLALSQRERELGKRCLIPPSHSGRGSG